MNKLIIKDLDMLVDAKLLNYGCMRDCINMYSGEFVSGKTYGIVGEFGSGNWALSYILSGKVPLRRDLGKILINNVKADEKILQKSVCYVGDININEPKSIRFKNQAGKWTIKNQILRGLKKTKSEFKLEEIAEIFHLSGLDDPKGRINRVIEQISGERWFASLGIGFSEGKKIFCFPLLHEGYFFYLCTDIMKNILAFLKEHDSIIIIPFLNEEYSNALSDTTLIIDNKYKSLVKERLNIRHQL